MHASVLGVCVFFIRIIMTSFYRISVFSFNIRLIFLYVISYCLLVQFLSHHHRGRRRRRRKTSKGGMRVIRVLRGLMEKGIRGGREGSLFKSSRSPFSLSVFLFSRFALF